MFASTSNLSHVFLVLLSVAGVAFGKGHLRGGLNSQSFHPLEEPDAGQTGAAQAGLV